MFVKFVGEKNNTWEHSLDMCVYAYNTSRYTCTSSKFIPFEVMLGRRAVHPVDAVMATDSPKMHF